MELRWRSEWTVPSVVGAVTFGIGVGVGYGIRTYQLKKSIQTLEEAIDVVESEVVQLQLDLKDRNEEIYQFKKDNAIKFVESLRTGPNWESSVAGQAEMQAYQESIFPNEDDEWSYDEEMPTRTPEVPYVIHVDEYMDNDTNNSQSTLTYYAGDKILVDELDTPIYNAEKVASPLIFGHGSKDPSIVYIRNERLEADYEVLLDHGFYQVEVLGQEFEHSFENKKEPLQKFREE